MELPATSEADKTDEAAAAHAEIQPGGLQNATLACFHLITVSQRFILILCGAVAEQPMLIL